MRKFVMGLAMASTALATPALAREGQWYVGVDGGVMIVEDTSVNNGDASVEHDKGFDFGGVVGHDFGAFRLESEVSYKEAQLESISLGETIRSNSRLWASSCFFSNSVPMMDCRASLVAVSVSFALTSRTR